METVRESMSAGGMKSSKVLNKVSSSYELFEADPEDDVIPTQSNPFRAPSIAEIYKIIEPISINTPSSIFIVKSREDMKKYVLKKIECEDESAAVKAFFEQSSVFLNIISKYFPCGNLQKWIQEYQDKAQLASEKSVKNILGDILNGLVYMHEKGIIHRNIKPSNIFFRQCGSVVLADLGVSTLNSDMRTNTRQTLRGILYLAPETAYQSHDEKSDLYSLGAVLLNMLTTSTLSNDGFFKKFSQIKEFPEMLNEVTEGISEIYSKSMTISVQLLLRHKHSIRFTTLEFIKSGFIQECMANASHSDTGKKSTNKVTKQTVATVDETAVHELTDVSKMLDFISNNINHEASLAEGLSILADHLRDNYKAHTDVDQKARSMIMFALWDNIFNMDIIIPGCYVLSNLVASSQPSAEPTSLLSSEIFTFTQKIMTAFEYEPEVQLAAVNLILAISTDKLAAQQAVENGGMHAILVAMRHSRHNATLNALSCMALWSLTLDDENLKVAGKEHAVRDVCIALSIHKVSPQVCESASACLISLLLDETCYDPFNELDCVGNLIYAIHLHTECVKVVKNCCKVLSIVVEANAECAYRFLTSAESDKTPRGIPTIVAAYSYHKDNAMVVESIVRLLLELSNYDDINSEMQAAMIAQTLLLEIHNRYRENKDIMGPCELALEKLGSPQTVMKNSAMGLQVAPPSRLYRFEGEVQSSCRQLLSRWHRDSMLAQGQKAKINAELNTRMKMKKKPKPSMTSF
ncbi:serine/threonine kinase-like domain-containing protein STKLD1 isoform X2 [Physella acuta]|uniref:serine/threonine kinase-like domain-containing protein STKLD1 isoform X2 n=1 Tax=Physella acuta TaxID=109671 RepID=UPI0027DC9C9E|nr:serine/threonine kinase-like domain-containing protein STKLD1 isoform X2 [Physella acuta]